MEPLLLYRTWLEGGESSRCCGFFVIRSATQNSKFPAKQLNRVRCKCTPTSRTNAQHTAVMFLKIRSISARTWRKTLPLSPSRVLRSRREAVMSGARCTLRSDNFIFLEKMQRERHAAAAQGPRGRRTIKSVGVLSLKRVEGDTGKDKVLERRARERSERASYCGSPPHQHALFHPWIG